MVSCKAHKTVNLATTDQMAAVGMVVGLVNCPGGAAFPAPVRGNSCARLIGLWGITSTQFPFLHACPDNVIYTGRMYMDTAREIGNKSNARGLQFYEDLLSSEHL